MAELRLRCVDKKLPRGGWLLLLGDDGVRLLDGEDEEWAAFPQAAAHERFIFPSFWQSVKHLGVVTARQGTLWFDADERAVARIREYLAGALAAQGPEAIRAIRRRGRWWLYGGITLIVLGVVGLVVSLAVAVGGGGTRAVPGIGLLVAGAVVTARGGAILSQANRAADEAGLIE